MRCDDLQNPLLLCLPCGRGECPDGYFVLHPSLSTRRRRDPNRNTSGAGIIFYRLLRVSSMALLVVSAIVAIRNRAVPSLKLRASSAIDPPSISVCVAANADDLNHGNLRRLARSIEEQTRRPDEVILTLSAYDIACKTASREVPSHWRVSCVPAQKSKAEVLNVAAELARGDVLSFIDADDSMNPERIRILHGLFKDRQKQNVDGGKDCEGEGEGEDCEGEPELQMVLHGSKETEINLDQVTLPLTKDYYVGGVELYTNAAADELLPSKPNAAIDAQINQMQLGHVTVRKELWEAVKFRDSEDIAAKNIAPNNNGDNTAEDLAELPLLKTRGHQTQFVKDAILKLGPEDDAMMWVKLPLSVHVPATGRFLDLSSNGGI